MKLRLLTVIFAVALSPAACLTPSLFGAAKLHGDPGCDYSVEAMIGNETFKLIVDTGSSTLAVASRLCKTCLVDNLHDDADVQPTLSNRVSVTYGSGSWSGIVEDGEMTIAGLPAVSTNFASIRSHRNFFQEGCRHKFDGILGLAYERIGRGNIRPLIDTLASKGVANNFAIQLCGPKDEAPGSMRSGNFWIGGLDPGFMKNTMQFTPIAKEYYYNVHMTSIKVGEKLLSDSLYSIDTIVDSGTTQLILNDKSLYTALISEIRAQKMITFGNPAAVDAKFWNGEICHPKSDVGYKLNKNVTVTLSLFGGVQLNLTQEHLFREVLCDENRQSSEK